MESRLLIDGDGAAAAVGLAALADWLRFEDELRGRIRFEHHPVAAGEPVGPPEALVVTLPAAGAVGVLATALVEWVGQRIGAVTVKAVRADGSSFEVRATDGGPAREPAERLRDFLLAGPPHGADPAAGASTGAGTGSRTGNTGTETGTGSDGSA